jgi:hypothetical protein
MNKYTDSGQTLSGQPVTMDGRPHHLANLGQRVLGTSLGNVMPSDRTGYGSAVDIKLNHEKTS